MLEEENIFSGKIIFSDICAVDLTQLISFDLRQVAGLDEFRQRHTVTLNESIANCRDGCLVADAP